MVDDWGFWSGNGCLVVFVEERTLGSIEDLARLGVEDEGYDSCVGWGDECGWEWKMLRGGVCAIRIEGRWEESDGSSYCGTYDGTGNIVVNDRIYISVVFDS